MKACVLLAIVAMFIVAANAAEPTDSQLGIAKQKQHVLPELGTPINPTTKRELFCLEEIELCLSASSDGRMRLIVPGATRLLPEFPALGLKPERVIIKKDGIILKYSF